MNNSAWQEIYKEWKYWNPDLDVKERGRIVRGCVGKLAYDDFMVALKSAASLEAGGTYRKGKFLSIYQCQICRMIHIGNTKFTPARDVDREYFGGERAMQKFGERVRAI